MREKGTFDSSFSLEPKIQWTLDARQLIHGSVEDLILESTWNKTGEGVFLPVGFFTSVAKDPDETKNGIYRLKDLNYKEINNWEKIGSIITIDSVLYTPQSDKTEEEKAIARDNIGAGTLEDVLDDKLYNRSKDRWVVYDVSTEGKGSSIPVGGMVKSAWSDLEINNNGEIWLKCDGRALDVSMYPELDALLESTVINVSPRMTSDTAPVPYVTSASNIYDGNYIAARLFDSFTSGLNGWVTGDNSFGADYTGSQYWQLDFGSKTRVNKYNIIEGVGFGQGYPLNWTIQGSDDGINFIDVQSYTVESWLSTETKRFEITGFDYQIFRMLITKVSSTSHRAVRINEVELYQNSMDKLLPNIPIDSNGFYTYIKAFGYVGELGSSSTENAVLYTPQPDKTEEEKAIARANIGIEENADDNKLNVIPDPHFTLGNAMDAYSKYPRLYNSASAINNRTTFNSETGIMTAESFQNTRKAFHIMAKFPKGWATKFNIVEGSKIILGCYVKYEAADIATATLEQWGSFYDNALSTSEIPYTPLAAEEQSDTTPIDDFVWFQRTITVVQGGTKQPIDEELNFSLIFWRLTDPNASSLKGSKIYMKDPCIILNAKGDEQGFYETYRENILISAEYITTDSLSVDNFVFKNLETTAEELDILNVTNFEARNISSDIIKLKENYTFPSDGNYIGYKDKELVISESGKETYLANKQFTMDEWNALTDEEKAIIGCADILGQNTIPVFSPVYTVSAWNALTDEEKVAIDSADVVED